MKKLTSLLSVILAVAVLFSTTAFAAKEAFALTSVMYGETDLSTGTAEVPGNAEIVITFTNNVTDEACLNNNINKITVRDKDGQAANATISAGTEGKILVVTLGTLEKGNYTLTIGQKVQNKDLQELGTKYEYTFTIKGNGSGSGTGTGGGTNPCSVETVKVEDKDLKDLDLTTESVITIQFGRGMSENQTANKELISVVNTETNEKAGITVGEVYNKNYVDVTITEIEPGEYKLVLGKEIKSNNGQTLGEWNNGEDYTVSFTYKIAEANCTCMCHAKKGIKAILWKIVLFFDKLFGINPVCECGKIHYSTEK